jgi:hypothetical protein
MNFRKNNITELNMMFSKIALLASLLFFLCGTNGFAYSHPVKTTPNFKSGQTESLPNKSTITVLTVSNKNSTIQAPDIKNIKNETANAVLVTKKNRNAQPSFKDYAVPATVCLLLIVVLSSYWFGFRKKFV